MILNPPHQFSRPGIQVYLAKKFVCMGYGRVGYTDIYMYLKASVLCTCISTVFLLYCSCDGGAVCMLQGKAWKQDLSKTEDLLDYAGKRFE